MNTLPGEASKRLVEAVKDRYHIRRLIGSGASSKVFLAEDIKHGRSVALKVLHSELAASVGAQRFSREIRVAARLSHPHILSVFDSGDADGLLWYVMPFVEGESVRERLTRETRLPVNDVVSITRQVSDALAYAHEQGVVHRDVKPENILLSRSHALIADFGVAKTTDNRLVTDAGMTLGTPAYMSPEQASGEQVIDGRSDVYALGCLMYEMLTGKPAFTGKTVPVILAQVMTVTPRSISAIRDDIPDQLFAAIEISMAKDPAERFQTAGQLADALRWAETPVSVPVVHAHQPMPQPEPLPPVAQSVATPQSAFDPPVIGIRAPTPLHSPEQSSLFDNTRETNARPAPFAPSRTPGRTNANVQQRHHRPSKLAITLIVLVFILALLLVALVFKNP